MSRGLRTLLPLVLVLAALAVVAHVAGQEPEDEPPCVQYPLADRGLPGCDPDTVPIGTDLRRVSSVTSRRSRDRDRRPTVRHMIHDERFTSRTHITIQGPRRAWSAKAKRALKRFDRRVGGLRMRRGRCRAHPHNACIKIRLVRRPRANWMGEVGFPRRNWTTHRVIRLNTYYKRHRYAIAIHEAAHALGLWHHNRWGVVGRWRNVTNPSWVEIRALRRTYWRG